MGEKTKLLDSFPRMIFIPFAFIPLPRYYFNSRASFRHSLTLRIPFSESIPRTLMIIDLFMVNKDSHLTTEATFIPA